MLCSLIHISSVKVFIETLRINFLAIGPIKKWYSSTYLGIQVLGISKAFFFFLLLELIEFRFSLRFLAENYVLIMVRHLWSLTRQLCGYLILTHSLRGMKLTFYLPAINCWSLWARSTLFAFGRLIIILRVPYYLGSFLIYLIVSFISFSHVHYLVNSCIDEWFI